MSGLREYLAGENDGPGGNSGPITVETDTGWYIEMAEGVDPRAGHFAKAVVESDRFRNDVTLRYAEMVNNGYMRWYGANMQGRSYSTKTLASLADPLANMRAGLQILTNRSLRPFNFDPTFKLLMESERERTERMVREARPTLIPEWQREIEGRI